MPDSLLQNAEIYIHTNPCRCKAISFPESKELRKFYAKNKIWDRVKQELIKEGKMAIAEAFKEAK